MMRGVRNSRLRGGLCYALALVCASLCAPRASAARARASLQHALVPDGMTAGVAARQDDAGARSDQGELRLFDLSTHPYARCLDGSPAGYYISHGSADLVVINLEGGGECVDKESCQVRPLGTYGRSQSTSA